MRLFTSCLLLLFILLDGCIEPLEISSKTIVKLVVDGLVTNEPGPYTVKLSLSSPTEENLIYAAPVSNATVSILENESVSHPMTAVAAGVYQSATDWQAQVGKRYAIRIVTQDKKEFESPPQTLEAPGVIDNVYAEFEKEASTGGDDGTLVRDAINILIDAKGGNTESNRLRWRFTGEYHARTFPELHTTIDLMGNIHPAPWPCSGYIAVGDNLIKVGECSCCECWPTEEGHSVALSTPEVSKDANYKKIQVAQIPVTGRRFINMYRVTIEQFSLSAETFQFWKLIKTQQESAGSIFQPNAVKVKGNVVAKNNTDDVLGLFAVCGVTSKSIYIDQSNIPYAVAPEILTEPCKETFKNATDKPSYWP